MNKSEIMPIENVENMEVLALELGCKVGALASSYLGLSLRAHHLEWHRGKVQKEVDLVEENIFLRVGELRSLEALFLVCSSTSCLFFVCLGG